MSMDEQASAEYCLWRLQAALEQEPRAGIMKWGRAALMFLGSVVILGQFIPLAIACSLGIVFAVADLSYISSGERYLQEATARAAELDEPRALPLLLRARRVGNDATRKSATAGLCRILPLLTSDDRAWISRATLREIDELLTRFEPDTIDAALSALDKLGDTQSLEHIHSLLGRKRSAASSDSPELGPVMVSWFKDFPRLGAHAGRVASNLKVRLEEEARHATLLRASDSGQALLRPATSSADADPNSLLRPK